jgi:beta-glucanase (GH16 family)
MEAHRRSPIGAQLVDGAIVVLSVVLIGWVGLIVAAQLSGEGKSSEPSTGVAPPPAGPAGSLLSAPQREGWKLVWHDEFNGSPCPSRAKWSFEHGFVRNGELQWYEPRNAYCHRGVLVLEARREERRNPRYRSSSRNWKLNRPVARYTSASIAGKYHFTYGRAEALIRIDPRSGSWPAFWTLGDGFPRRNTVWPAAGEVDIMEYYENTVLANVCNPKPSWCGWSTTARSLTGLGGQEWADRFHLWAMDWSHKRIEIYLDGSLVNRVRLADVVHPGRRNPYVNQPAFLLLSQAIGGVHGGDPANTDFPIRLEAKYVRVYQRAEEKDRQASNQ